MTHRTRTALAALSLAAAGIGMAAPAQADSTGCTGTEGVTVVVDKALSCAKGDPTTALDALKAAGHEVTPVSTFAGAICQIDGKPEGADCTKMPAADAFWGFYTAEADQAWGFAPKGANEVDPAPGSAIGFSFGDGKTQPAAAFAGATDTASSATTSATDAASSAATSATDAASSAATSATDAASSAATSATDAASSAAASATDTASASPTSEAADTTTEEEGTSIWKWLLPLLALALIGGLIAALMRRRTPEQTEGVVTERYVPDTDRDVRVREDLRGTDARDVREGDLRDGDYRDPRDGDLRDPRDDRNV
ncbi:hypothetical protein ACQP1U_11605 [Actinomycetota bacterium]